VGRNTLLRVQLSFLTLPLGWFLLFFLIPLGLVVLVSFWRTADYKIIRQFTLENYSGLFQPLYISTFLRALRVALVATVMSAVLSYPVAYYLARKVHRFRTLLLLLVILPLWTSYLVRSFAWMLILGTNGIINELLRSVGLIRESLSWLLYSEFAVTVALVHVYMPFMVLPLYAVLEKLDKGLLEAAQDLGASGWRTFWHITFPLSISGLATGCLFVFIPAIASYITPELLGGTRSVMIGSIIAQKFGISFEYPLGSAMALVLMAVILATASLVLRYGRPKGVQV
jgi:spermidine/putrescine transport system permease protein